MLVFSDWKDEAKTDQRETYQNLDSEVLQCLWETQNQFLLNKNASVGEENKEKHRWVLVAVDSNTIKQLQSEVLKTLYLNGHHVNVTVWVAAGDVDVLPLYMWFNTNIVVVTAGCSQSHRQKAHQAFFQEVEAEDFESWLSNHTTLSRHWPKAVAVASRPTCNTLKSTPKTMMMSKFTGENLELGSGVLIIGNRASGKTTMLLDLFHKNRWRFAHTVLFSSTEPLEKKFSNLIPETFMYNEVNERALENIVKRQYYCASASLAENILVIIDNCINLKALNTEIMKRIWMNKRHLNISIWMVCDYMNLVPLFIERAAEYVAVFKERNKSLREKAYQMFFNSISVDRFEKFTEETRCLVASNLETQCPLIQYY